MAKLAYNDRAFWETHAPYASASLLADHYPPSAGGLSNPGWYNAIRRAKVNFPTLPWLVSVQGEWPAKPATWPAPVYADGTVGQPSESVEGKYLETVEVMGDGSCKSDLLLEMSATQAKDPEYLLRAHGFDPSAWELVTAKNNIWNVYSKKAEGNGHDVSTLYSSRITVKPRTSSFDLETVLEAVKRVKPVTVPKTAASGERLLEIPLFDMHFGVSTLSDYTPTLERIVTAIERHRWEEIVLAVGSDLFHNDNLRGTTAKGTVVDAMDCPVAWADAATFYATVIEQALTHAQTVLMTFVKGNHDESMSWAFCQYLCARYPQLVADLRIEERKVHRYGSVCIGFTHGDKAGKDFDRMFFAEEPEFATARVKEIHIGHTHHEQVKDQHGVVTRTMATAAKTDRWHKDNGYVGTNKRFQLFTYDQHSLLAITYV